MFAYPEWALFRALGVVALAAVSVLSSIFLFQRRLIYHPRAEAVALPATVLFDGLRDVRIDTSDGVRLHAWYWPGRANGYAILFLHGNAGDRSDRRALLRALHDRGYALLALDYRGYGGSEGSPSEAGLYLDAEAAASWLVAAGHERLVYFGESLGTAVAVELARRRTPHAMVLEAPFDSLVNVAQHHFPWLPVHWLLSDRFWAAKRISEVDAPVLVIHGEQDTVVPQARGRALFDAAASAKTWISVPGAGHNDLRDRFGARYLAAVDAFLQ